jgi:hypothetical protein
MKTLIRKNEKDLEISRVCEADHHDLFPQARWARHMVVALPLANTAKPVNSFRYFPFDGTDLCILEGLMLPDECALD